MPDWGFCKATAYTGVLYGAIGSFGIYVIFLIFSGICILMHKLKQALYAFYLLLACITVDIFFNLYIIIINPKVNDNGLAILIDATLIWAITLLTFTIWYWLIDKNGPIARIDPDNKHRIDLLFPQYQTQIKGWEIWHPEFVDYFFLSFFTGTSFAPADTLPLSRRIKLLMMLEAFLSLTIIGMVLSRAVSLI